MKRALVAFAACAALAACGRAEQKSYPADYQFNFMRACEAQSDLPGLCACTWERIEAQIDPNDFAALERLPGPERQAHPLTQQIEQITLACHASLSQAQPAEPTPEP
ncbi:MAG: hypothetical protein KJZ75_14180 [Hyphomonadaceae bacterium]|nr:hypothetical protein [Hyphomonadaceae bacterium]GIK51021.1 MAG: hypothetical protein BroJett013_37180 [Alphaproteobacteria bacterium]